ncbi:MAG: tRNA lysidine(34) synthetase TilS [Rhodanobacteraceae bacterium]
MIETALAGLPSAPLLVAFSGGIDSSALLHALAGSAAARKRGLRAAHIDHGLHRDSGEWAEHCRAFACAHEVELIVRSSQVKPDPGLGLEASARQTRYAELEALLAPGEIMALAHHRDDQAETILLKLLRGAGPEGLAGMRAWRRFGAGFAWRPLLDLPRALLHAYATQHEITWIDDPSNADMRFARNFLRHALLPEIAQRWPHSAASITQSATWLRATADFIDTEAARALAGLRTHHPAILDAKAWLDLPLALRDPVLRHWLRSLALPEPTHLQVRELQRQLATAGRDREPCVRWLGVELRRYRDRLYALAPMPAPPIEWQRPFDGSTLDLPAAIGSLRLVSSANPAQTVRLVQPLKVRFRRGGERLQVAGSGLHRELRKLWQEADVPPWQRAREPLVVCADGELLAVADRWLSTSAVALFDRLQCRIVFETPPTARATAAVSSTPSS